MEFPSQFVFIIWCKLGLAQLLFVFKSILRLQPSVCLLSVSISYMPNILQESSASFWSRPWSLELLYDQHCQRWWKALRCMRMHAIMLSQLMLILLMMMTTIIIIIMITMTIIIMIVMIIMIVTGLRWLLAPLCHHSWCCCCCWWSSWLWSWSSKSSSSWSS